MYKATAFIDSIPILTDKEILIKSPIDNSEVGYIPALNEEQILEAFEVANKAFKNWSQVDHKTKSKYLLAFAAKLREHAFVLQNILHRETGKSLESAKEEIIRSADYIVESVHAYSDLVENPEEYSYENNVLIPKNITATYLRVPLGVVLTISPFNYPVNLMITKVVPAILAGNTVVHKSAMQGSLSGWYVAKLFNELTVDEYLITPGVLNYVTGKGSEISKALIKSPHIKALSFTGSTEIGKEIGSQLANIPKQLELGGHNSAIVLKDADLSLAISEILKGAFGFSGQRCTAIKKVFVSSEIYERFIELFMKELKDFPPLQEPLINESAVAKAKLFYEDALNKGANLLSGELNIRNNLVSPIVFENVTDEMFISSEELFAPVIALRTFKDIKEAISLCNKSNYGLQASIFSENIEDSSQLALSLECGRININSAPSRSPDILPFLGVKDSGMEVQGIKNSLYFFTKFKGIVYKKV
ncbi:glyceraldehyde-3-phosphate dehydrogenase [Candidatus Mycoplasma haematobovis]|uniref:Glyceraldehyde-3-phosphate dehydrogenase n=1 Tax=Candidatus Mycoplasma haematobovis TaxID=432608 RepID=A0A1A9QCW2_9MOLU|nr:aldehyde dehydrogenase family protein [Candidatus Mycoplasma haematobovis]OAL10307.1 glyceraldehyde-3-phosphate dehydrogenase [Candidatus Mycoplasma haematobovis]